MTATTKTMEKPRLSAKAQTLAAGAAVVCAVALPQIFHLMGALTGLGTALGETFLPMHLPIILVGLLAGPYAGAVSGFAAPLISHALSGMPGAGMLPFMMLELCIYGLCAGALRGRGMPTLAKVVITQAAGRIVRALAILLAVYGLGNTTVQAATIWTSIPKGAFGLALQWTLLPLLVYWVENRNE